MLRLELVGGQEVVAEWRQAAEDAAGALVAAFTRGGEAVVDLFRNQWLNGRRGDGLGLHQRTGNLFQSVDSATQREGGKIVSEVFNRGADYWWYHENPQGGRTQYLHLEEAFATDGAKLFTDSIEDALARIG